MTLLATDSNPVLLRSRSLMRGIFHHKCHEHSPTPNKDIVSGECVVTHSSSSATLSSWEDDDSQNDDNSYSQCVDSRGVSLLPIIDDTSELEHSRRVAIASSHGHTYDETKGVQAILNSLTPRERKHLADENMPLRHYRAEKGNLDEAIRKIKNTLKWREEFGVEDIKQCFDQKNGDRSPEKEKELTNLANIISQENQTGKIYCRGYDKDGRAILYLTPGLENSTNEINNMRHLVYHLERAIACSRRHSGRQKVCIVIGYQGFKLSNAPPLSTVKHTLTILQGHYPERMHRAYICDPPFVFRTFWNIIKHFVDPATLEKIAFCHGKEGQKLLERDFNTMTTERCAGGKMKLRDFCSKEFLFDTPFDRTFDEDH